MIYLRRGRAAECLPCDEHQGGSLKRINTNQNKFKVVTFCFVLFCFVFTRPLNESVNYRMFSFSTEPLFLSSKSLKENQMKRTSLNMKLMY